MTDDRLEDAFRALAAQADAGRPALRPGALTPPHRVRHAPAWLAIAGLGAVALGFLLWPGNPTLRHPEDSPFTQPTDRLFDPYARPAEHRNFAPTSQLEDRAHVDLAHHFPDRTTAASAVCSG